VGNAVSWIQSVGADLRIIHEALNARVVSMRKQMERAVAGNWAGNL
jgi:hypothetical protein